MAWDLDSNVEFVPTASFVLGSVPRLLGSAAGWQDSYDVWKAQRDAVDGFPIGYFVFRDVYCVGPVGAVIDPAAGRFMVGQSLNWSGEFATWNMKTVLPATVEIPGGLDIPITGACEEFDELVMLAGPGFDIFGHQLLDYGPRARFVAANEQLARVPAARQTLKPWADVLSGPFRESGADRILADGEIVFCKTLYVPSSYKYLGHLCRNQVGGFAADLIRHRGIEAGGGPDRLYLSRGGWAANVRSADEATWEERYRNEGFGVVKTHELALDAQLELFRGARRMAGLDGSALHGAMFANALNRLDVIDSGRVNLLHLAVASLLDEIEVRIV